MVRRGRRPRTATANAVDVVVVDDDEPTTRVAATATNAKATAITAATVRNNLNMVEASASSLSNGIESDLKRNCGGSNGLTATIESISDANSAIGNNYFAQQLQESHQHFASPKRKDCKVDKQLQVESYAVVGDRGGGGMMVSRGGEGNEIIKSENLVPNGDVLLKPKGGKKSGGRGERGNKQEKKAATSGHCKISPTIDLTDSSSGSSPISLTTETASSSKEDEVMMTTNGLSPVINVESDESSSNCTEFSDNACAGANALFDLSAYRDVSQSSSFRSSTSDVENIFLQEPVLKLNVDKSPLPAACCMKINKSLDTEPIFSSPPSSLATAALNGRFSQIVSLNSSPVKQQGKADSNLQMGGGNCFDYKLNMNGFAGNFASTVNNNNNLNLNDEFLESLNTTPLGKSVVGGGGGASSVTRSGRKPTTPHRIVVCGSPIKTKYHATSGVSITTSPSKRNASNKDDINHQSPRKSQRHMHAAIAATQPSLNLTKTKTRRRLNQKGLDLYLASNQTSSSSGLAKSTKTQTSSPSKTSSRQKQHLQMNGFKGMNGLHPYHITANDSEESEEEVEEALSEENHHQIFDDHLEPHQAQVKIEQDDEQKPDLQKLTSGTGTTAQKQQQNHSQKYNKSSKQQKPLKNKTAAQLIASQQMPLTNGNREMTDYFPVRRRSERKTKTAVKEEMMKSLEQAILEEREEGLKIGYFDGKGRGVIADRHFKRGEFVVEYVGDLISISEASNREKRYALDENAGCYMYYFKHKNQQYCIDATIDSGKFGRLVNHSRNGNLVTKVVVVKQRPHLVLIAKDDIQPGEELTYDYGDRSKLSLLHHPWLAF